MQRLKVALTGLAAVVLLIGIAGAIFSAVDRNAPVEAAGAARPEVVANLTGGAGVPTEEAAIVDEPLAELGVAPSKSAGDPVNVTVTEQPPNPGAPQP
ncbi:hypothetical protein [Sphingomonas sp. IW22]|uniref:hypothetical protein n=1 Tax=Sphingomonas sp. IW22 TaxID=3242489 RepID=UPI00352177EB